MAVRRVADLDEGVPDRFDVDRHLDGAGDLPARAIERRGCHLDATRLRMANHGESGNESLPGVPLRDDAGHRARLKPGVVAARERMVELGVDFDRQGAVDVGSDVRGLRSRSIATERQEGHARWPTAFSAVDLGR